MMDQAGFDHLAKTLSTGAGSRRHVLQVLGAAAIGTPLLTLFPDSAAGIGKKRCTKKHGKYLTSGECSCAVTWYKGEQVLYKFRCSDTETCSCYVTVDGSGFCANWHMTGGRQGCESNAECDAGASCAVLPGYSKGKSCGPTAPCTDLTEACVNGTCQYTSCRPPCSS